MKKLLLVLLLLAGSAGATSYEIHKGLGAVFDTVGVAVIYGQLQVRDSVRYTSVGMIDTSIELGADTIFTILIAYKNNGGFWQSYTEQFLNVTNDTVHYWNRPAFLGVAMTDSLVVKDYENGVLVLSDANDAVTAYTGYKACRRDTVYRCDLDWWVQGRSVPVTQTYLMQWDSLGNATAVSTQAHVCAVTVRLLNSDRTPAVNVYVSAYLTRSNVKDSAGYGYTNTPIYKQTNSQGIAVFNCVWSNYLIPKTMWRFSAFTGVLSGVRKDLEVPNLSSYVLDLSK